MADNFILHAESRQYQWSGECFLSIKSFYNGPAIYQVRQREYHVNEHNFLILNDCTKYNVTIDNTSPVESFCVFFSPEFVSTVISTLNAKDEHLLDFRFQKTEGFKLLERNFQRSGPVSKILLEGRQRSPYTMSTLEKDEFYQNLLSAIFFQNSASLREADKLCLKKASTREEIYRRIYYAKDYIDANYIRALTLKEISEIAMLSENHLLRCFSQIFNTSPFQYITRLKIARATRLVMETDKSISEIAFSLGYSSMSNFSHYFKSIVGQSPMELRKKVIQRKY